MVKVLESYLKCMSSSTGQRCGLVLDDIGVRRLFQEYRKWHRVVLSPCDDGWVRIQDVTLFLFFFLVIPCKRQGFSNKRNAHKQYFVKALNGMDGLGIPELCMLKTFLNELPATFTYFLKFDWKYEIFNIFTPLTNVWSTIIILLSSSDYNHIWNLSFARIIVSELLHTSHVRWEKGL